MRNLREKAGLTNKTDFKHIGGLHCRHVGGQNKRKCFHIVCIKMELTPRGEKSYCSCPPTWPP